MGGKFPRALHVYHSHIFSSFSTQNVLRLSASRIISTLIGAVANTRRDGNGILTKIGISMIARR